MDRKYITPEHLAACKSIVTFEWSRDDETIFYVTNLNRFFQVWAVPSRGGYPRQLTMQEDGDVRDLRISPDGSLIAFVVDSGGKEDYNLCVIPATGGNLRRINGDFKISLPMFRWSPDNSRIAFISEKDGAYNIAAIDVNSCEVEWITNTPDLKMELDWAGDGKKIAFTSVSDKLRSDICIVDLATKELTNITSGLKGENQTPEFSPDGKILGFTSDSNGSKNACIIYLDMGKTVWMPAKDCERYFGRWNCSGDKFTYLENHEAEFSVYQWNFPPTTGRRISPDGYAAGKAKFSNNDDRIAMLLSSPSRPPEIYVKENKSFRKITDSTLFGIDPDSFVAPEKIRYRSSEGLEIPALFYKPKDMENYPALIWIHGGPTGQHLNMWNVFVQLFLLKGIAVLAPNIRGSSGYGRDFENMVYHDWGGGDLEDIAHAVKFLRRESGADPEKIIVGGGSYGGYLTMMAVSKYPDLWAAGINIMGPVNLETLYHQSASWMKPILQEKYGFLPPEEDPEYYRDRSSINFVDDVKCPLLLLYGENDPRVPVNEMDQLREKLTNGGKTFEYELFGDEGHSMSRLETRIQVFQRMLRFIEEKVLQEKIVEQTAPQNIEDPVEQKMEQPEEIIAEEMTEQIGEQPVGQPTEEPVEVMAEPSVEKSEEQPEEQNVEQPEEQIAKQPEAAVDDIADVAVVEETETDTETEPEPEPEPEPVQEPVTDPSADIDIDTGTDADVAADIDTEQVESQAADVGTDANTTEADADPAPDVAVVPGDDTDIKNS